MTDTKSPTRAKVTAKQSGESAQLLREFYEQMVLIREFELRAGEMYAKARIGGYCHLNLGEEATDRKSVV